MRNLILISIASTALLGAPTAALAVKNSTVIGAGAGAVAGGVVAGPVGAVAGGVAGGYVGSRYHTHRVVHHYHRHH